MASSPEGFKDPKKKVRKAREAEIEKHGGDNVKSKGGMTYKFVSPGRRGVPDRIKLFPIPEEHREIVARYLVFVEYKREGEVPKPDQVREIGYLRGMGFKVLVIDSKEGADDAFRSY